MRAQLPTEPIPVMEQPAPSASKHRHSSLERAVIGGAFLGAATAATVGIYFGEGSDERAALPMPYFQTGQEVVTGIDDALQKVGEVGLVIALGTIGGVKIAAQRDSRRGSIARAIDVASSKEPTTDGNHEPGRTRRGLQKAFAGKVPAVASVGVALGAFTCAIGTEVTEGPSRPIRAFQEVLPGEAMIVQYEGAMPMVQSNVSAELSAAARAEATRRGIASIPLDLNLGMMITPEGRPLTDLTVGLDVAPGSPLDWKPAQGCEMIPLKVDESANVTKEATVRVNGMTAKVVDHLHDSSAINRVGLAMDREAVNTCLEQSSGVSGDHAVVLDTDPETAKDILKVANADLREPGVVITKQGYIENSEKFWEANGKPVTNVLGLVSLAAVLISLGGNLNARVLRNRRELAADIARRIPISRLRFTELLRSTKDGVLATAIGVPAAMVATPVANTLVAGFRAGIGYKEAMMGAAVGLIGAWLSNILPLARLRKTVNPQEHTR